MSPDAAIERAVRWAVRALADGETVGFVAAVLECAVDKAVRA